MEVPQIIKEYERRKEYQEQLAKDEGKENFIYDIEEEMQKDFNNLSSSIGTGFGSGSKHNMRRIAKVTSLDIGLRFLKEQKKKKTKSKETEQATIRQAAIAFYFMRQAQKFPSKSGSYKTDADFIFFLTGLNPDRMRKEISNPFARTENSKEKAVLELIKDVTLVRSQFELIQFQTGVTLANEKLQELENDLQSFNE